MFLFQGSSIKLRISGRSKTSIEQVRSLIKQFEEKKYSKKQLLLAEAHRLTDQDVKTIEKYSKTQFSFVKFQFEALKSRCQSQGVVLNKNSSKSQIEIEGLHEDLESIEKFLNDLTKANDQRTNNDLLNSIEWTLYDSNSQRPIVLDENLKRFLEKNFEENPKKTVRQNENLSSFSGSRDESFRLIFFFSGSI